MHGHRCHARVAADRRKQVSEPVRSRFELLVDSSQNESTCVLEDSSK